MTTPTEALSLALTCPWTGCGCRIWPPEQMDEHLALHDLKFMVYSGDLKKLQYAMGRLRDLPWSQDG